MTITTRTTTATGVTNKGSELSYAELDGNFIDLKQNKYEAGDDPTFGTITSTVDIDALDLTSTGTITANVLNVTTFTSTAIDDNSTQGTKSFLINSNGTTSVLKEMTSTGANIGFSSAGNQYLIFSDTVSNKGAVRYDHVDNSMRLITEGTTAIYIDGTQQVGIGTDLPSSALDVAGDIECANLTAAHVVTAANLVATSTVTAVDFNTTSDYRVKENVIDVDPHTAELIDYLRVVEFNFKDKPDEKQVGFIAHELQSAIPGIVTGVKDGEELQTINMTKLVPYLVKALQETNAKVQELEKKLSELR